MMTSHDTHGPLVRPRLERLWTWADPLCYRTNFRYEFEMEVFDALETESFAVVMAGMKILKEGSTFNDYYGFGSSRSAAIEEAERFRADLAGANVDVVVTTSLKIQAVFHDDKTQPFYRGSVRCFHVPGIWHRQDPGPQVAGKTDYEIWRNGAPGAGALRLEERLQAAKCRDVAGDRRKGSLR